MSHLSLPWLMFMMCTWSTLRYRLSRKGSSSLRASSTPHVKHRSLAVLIAAKEDLTSQMRICVQLTYEIWISISACGELWAHWVACRIEAIAAAICCSTARWQQVVGRSKYLYQVKRLPRTMTLHSATQMHLKPYIKLNATKHERFC